LTEAAARSERGVALVTGGARRIGRAICLTLARAGFDVAIHHHASGEAARDLAEAIAGLGRRACLLQADLTDEARVRALVPAAAEALGPVTVLVNNASVFEDDRIGGLTRDSWDKHLETNLRAPIVLAEAFAAQTVEGAIVNLLDQKVLKPDPRFFSYSPFRDRL
jgi:NAD(P)-dependent dehydrogenase (short-subunit alcohol dehydrogenase family)